VLRVRVCTMEVDQACMSGDRGVGADREHRNTSAHTTPRPTLTNKSAVQQDGQHAETASGRTSFHRGSAAPTKTLEKKICLVCGRAIAGV